MSLVDVLDELPNYSPGDEIESMDFPNPNVDSSPMSDVSGPAEGCEEISVYSNYNTWHRVFIVQHHKIR